VLALVFSHTPELAGWSPDELLAVVGVHFLMGGVSGTVLEPTMLRMIEDVRRATLDYVLAKPEDAQLLVSVREVRIWRAIALLLGAVMLYCFWLVLAVGAFWFVCIEFIVVLFQASTRPAAGRSASTRTGCGWASPSSSPWPSPSPSPPRASPGASA
jgi:ABC-2 type transport system permease protein